MIDLKVIAKRKKGLQNTKDMSMSQQGTEYHFSVIHTVDDKIVEIIGETSQKAIMPDGDSESTTRSEEARTTNIQSTSFVYCTRNFRIHH